LKLETEYVLSVSSFQFLVSSFQFQVSNSMNKTRVLVVEDEHLVAKDIRRKLQNMDYDVPAVANSGDEAVKAALQARPDVVLMDIDLGGGMDGIEAASRIRAELDVPVIFVSAYANESLLERAKITTPFGYILKPFQNDALRNNIEIALYNQKQERKLKQSEEHLRAALKEKDLLMREIEHRVKNNLQAVGSMIQLQLLQVNEHNYRDILKEGELRVRAMGTIHNLLYRSDCFTHIDMRVYIRNLASELQTSYSRTVIVDAEPLDVHIDTAIPCGLLINELVTNSCKYAFPEGADGEITIGLHARNEMLELRVSDTGAGLPPAVVWPNPQSFGLRLVQGWGEQLRGTIELDRSAGASFTLTFPNREADHES